MATGSDLLQRFVPVVRYDSNEAFFADAVEEMAGLNDAVALVRAAAGGPGAVIAPAPVRSDLLAAGRYSNGAPVEAGDHLADVRRDCREQAAELHTRSELRNVVYGHAQTDRDGCLWLQYWFFYLYNDAGFAGNFGLHEGDWEMVQLRLAGEQPELAVYAQHSYSESRPWGEVEQVGGAPVSYPGRGTHASYFEPGLHKTEVWWDIADGMREAPALRLVAIDDPMPSWVGWPGRWGATQPRIPGVDSWSPVGPGQHPQWREPKLLLDQARGHERREPPPAPRVRVRRARGRLAIGFDFDGPIEGIERPDRLVATVNSPDEQAPPQTYTFTVDAALAGSLLTVRELDPRNAYDVRTSIVDAAGTPTAVQRVDVPALGPFGRLVAGLASLRHDLRLALRGR